MKKVIILIELSSDPACLMLVPTSMNIEKAATALCFTRSVFKLFT